MGACASSGQAPRGDQQLHPVGLQLKEFLPTASCPFCTSLPPSLCFPPALVTWHPETEPKNRIEYFCRRFCTQPPCLLCSTCVHGNNLHLPLLRGINSACLQFIFFTAVRPISIFLKNEFQIQKTLPCSWQRAQLKWLSCVESKMNYCSDLHISWIT